MTPDRKKAFDEATELLHEIAETDAKSLARRTLSEEVNFADSTVFYVSRGKRMI